MNEYDSDKISDLMQSINFVRSESIADVDCIIFNTCHIREKATEKVYSDIGKIKKLNRNKKKPIFVLAGCIAQAQGEEIFKRTNYVDIVLGPQSYHRLPQQVQSFIERKQNLSDINFEVIEKFDTLDNLKTYRKSKIAEFLTIQEGCDKFCTFCVVPYTRGAEFSRSFQSILNEAKKLADNGVREITLLGQNVSAYKYIDNDKIYNLAKLINEISKINSIDRIRFTTSHPNDMDEELIEAFKYQKKLMPQLHLPIQSGSNKILKLMNRKHTREYYLDLMDKFKDANPEIEFSSDFIIGFPGEDESDFQDTLDIVKRVNFINSYSFIYSQRPGTPAVERDQISLESCKDRLSILQELLADIQLKNNKSLIGKKIQILVENKTKNPDQFFGRSKFMHSVFFNSKLPLEGKLIDIEITDCNNKNLFGVLQKEKQEIFA
jgi:tRNA-2-methylthio-N6-dimethylallyladenosine synthase